MRSIIFIFILFLLASCAKKKAQEVEEAIDVALTMLSESKCDEAIQLLEGVGRQSEPVYIQVLASAYACKASFSEITFIATDVPSIDATSANLMKSLATMTLSDETTTDSVAYQNLWTAINLILSSGGGAQPLQANRAALFGVRKAGDLGLQVLFLTIVQLGKFLNEFGNVNSSGVKGLGTTDTNTCFLDYSYANAQAVIAALPGNNNCNSNTDGHPDLNITTSEGRRRACEGLMLITNLIDVLSNIDMSGDDTLGALEDVATTASSFKSTAVAADPQLGTLLNITSQTLCESTLASSAELNNLQLIYALIFETGLE